MYSYGHFKPGKSNNTSRMISYVEANNTATCLCSNNKFDKNTPGSDSVVNRISTALRISQLINYSRGGNTQYGSFYLGQPLNLNYLGRTEGMPGGSGSPPVNRF